MARMRYGEHPILEEEANRLIRESLKGVTRHSDKADILTPWKEAERKRHEVHVPSGTPDRANRQGMFGRAINPARPHLNSRDGAAQYNRRDAGAQNQSDIDSLGSFVEGFLRD